MRVRDRTLKFKQPFWYHLLIHIHSSQSRLRLKDLLAELIQRWLNTHFPWQHRIAEGQERKMGYFRTAAIEFSFCVSFHLLNCSHTTASCARQKAGGAGPFCAGTHPRHALYSLRMSFREKISTLLRMQDPAPHSPLSTHGLKSCYSWKLDEREFRGQPPPPPLPQPQYPTERLGDIINAS